MSPAAVRSGATRRRSSCCRPGASPGGRRPRLASGASSFPAPSAIGGGPGRDTGRRLPDLRRRAGHRCEALGGLVIGTVAGPARRLRGLRFPMSRDAILPGRNRHQRDPDHRLRAARQQLVRRSRARCRRWRSPRRCRLLPDHDQHPAGPDPGRAFGDRAHALIRRSATGRSCATCASRTRCPTSSPGSRSQRPWPHRRRGGRVLRRADRGAGPVVVAAPARLRFDITWAAIVVVSLIGDLLYLAVLAIEQVAIPWHASVRGRTRGLTRGPTLSLVVRRP